MENSKDKQIEEMASDLENHTCMSQYQAEIASRMLYVKGYRKSQDVAEEIFAEIETSLMIESFHGGEVYYAIRAEDYLHYKKKYTEEGK